MPAAAATAPSTRWSSAEEHDVDLPQRGVLSNYTIVTPVQYPGQTETEAFARVMIRLDGVDVVLGYQELIDVPVTDIHPGIRVEAMWASEAELEDQSARPDHRPRRAGSPPASPTTRAPTS